MATENFAAPDLADAANDALIKPRAAANRFIIQPAIDRGEVAPGRDIDPLCLVTPAMATDRTLFEQKPVDRDFIISLIDGVLLPALSLRAGDNPAAR